MKKAYIAGKITGDDDYLQKFQDAAIKLRAQGYRVMSPACLPFGFDYMDYMHICYSMIDIVEVVFFLSDWKQSPGARDERIYAEQIGKETKDI